MHAPSGGNVIAIGLYISHQISSESFTVFYRRTSGNTCAGLSAPSGPKPNRPRHTAVRHLSLNTIPI